MKTIQFKLVIFLFVGILFNSCAPEDDGIYFEKISETKSEYTVIELEILDLVNDYRFSKGLNTLIIPLFLQKVRFWPLFASLLFRKYKYPL